MFFAQFPDKSVLEGVLYPRCGGVSSNYKSRCSAGGQIQHSVTVSVGALNYVPVCRGDTH